MSVPTTVLRERVRLSPVERALALLAVGIARVLANRSPRRIRALLGRVRSGARPATAEQAAAARRAVVSVSVSCAGEGCLQRSIATALLCRFHGVWPTWRVGVRVDPFAAHAWVEADGVPVGEPHPPGSYRPILSVPPAGDDGA
ncbi:lasso peptide biosynthesis B2 protein [Amycolatopsis rhizosphaerae]|uniref:Lasso peptide biosynthesis B2 protein n=1 Tax=Amycolatopsis rhizosphaerae TaxID=2053003 RepID=A0A558BGI0_9PSEU|nr:lasso peptide biosynthesis B2 protein [Amycolatopsis rhizosphaerae]TVT35611.1 lasso peptide biosynthesis B2 protein [Amycolatopsis rhizosphaerae]